LGCSRSTAGASSEAAHVLHKRAPLHDERFVKEDRLETIRRPARLETPIT
jgi:hypothetical protein